MNSRGDWLAVALKDAFRTEDGTFDLTAFKFCMKNNGVTPPNVDMEHHEAIGLFGMCTGLRLRRHAAKVGFVVIDGKKICGTLREEAWTESDEGRSKLMT